jgi:ribosome-associated protein
LFKTIVNAISDKKGEDLIALDLRRIDEAVADFFILCDAKSFVQVEAIAGNVIEQTAKECSEKPFHVEMGDKWTIIDYANVVVHVFQHEQRLFYNLEGLWGDAPKFEYS